MSRIDEAGPSHQPSILSDLDPPPCELLETPLDFLFADHFRHRCLCGHLRRLARARHVAREDAQRISEFLTTDLPLHHRDEDDDLFPALRRVAKIEDNLDTILQRLAADHQHADRRGEAIVSTMKRLGDRAVVPISRSCAKAMLEFAAREHRHVSIENGIVLVIARKRLLPAALANMARTMKLRRGVAC